MTDNTLIPIDDIERMAQMVAASKLFGCKTKEEAMALMLISQSEGVHPMTAIQEFHIIQGKPARKAESILARFQKAGGSVKWLKYSDSEVSGEFSHPQGGTVVVTWNMARAKTAGFADKDNWKKFPAPMMRSRCISEGVRTVYPGATGGMYTPEEVEDMPPTPVKDMGAAEIVPSVVLPSYPQDQFDKNLSTWRDLIDSGTKTTEAIIVTIQSKYQLTENQKKQITSGPVMQEQPMGGSS